MTTLSSQFPRDVIRATKAKIVKRNTFARVENGETIIRLHGTDIVTKHADGSVTLDSGGWKTVTTKDRMNDHLPGAARLWQERGQWYVASEGKRVPFYDGIRVPQCFAGNGAAKGEKAEKQESKLRADIKRFTLSKSMVNTPPSSGICMIFIACNTLITPTKAALAVAACWPSYPTIQGDTASQSPSAKLAQSCHRAVPTMRDSLQFSGAIAIRTGAGYARSPRGLVPMASRV